ncbi:MAG TPA: hypothetical protein PJ982_11745 [Lacipirellulaceae bacterium]|nr:hypothetical protein [Lacipirellulaceae bacterium]
MITARRRPGKPRKPAEVLDNITDRNVVARDPGFRITGICSGTSDTRAWIFFNDRINDSLNASDLDGLTLEDGPFTRTIASVETVEDFWCLASWSATPAFMGTWTLQPNRTEISAARLPTSLQSQQLIDIDSL